MSSQTGTVKWFNNEKGYGFISTDQGDDIFLHHSQIKEKGNNTDIREGQEVSFDVVQKDKGPSAVNVQVF